MKTYVGIVRDHSGSMSGIARNAARDFNEVVTSLKEAGEENQIDTIVTTVECGRGRGRGMNAVRRDVVNSNVRVLQPIPETAYITDGSSTPLWDSVNETIRLLEAVPDFNDPEVTFVVMVITDGGENSSGISSSTLRSKIASRIASDRWTFTFRVPKGYGRTISNSLGVQDGNIYEWDGRSGSSMAQSTVATRSAVKNLYTARKSGTKSVGTFYADLSSVSKEEVKAALVDISGDVKFYGVGAQDHDLEIANFVSKRAGKTIEKGKWFYQLTKTEKAVQDYKKIAIRDILTGSVYAGDAARQMLGLPRYGDVRLVPGALGNYDVYIQSTSLNRKVKEGTKILYWEGATVDK